MASPQQKRPRLSLKIQTSVGPVARVSRPPTIDTKDPTAFNTLSNAYASVVGRSGLTAAHAEPLTAINTVQAFSLATPIEKPDPSNRANTPYTTHYPETPLSAHPTSAHPGSPRQLEIKYPSTMTATPPLSGTRDSNESKVFTFASTDIAHGKLAHRLYDHSDSNTKPRTIVYQPSAPGLLPPYTPSQARHSILRNSPLPAKTAIPPPSPRRQSLRLQERAARRVGYNSPLEQEITTNTYTRSHIDLLTDDASPLSPFSPSTPGGVNDSAGASPSSDMADAPKKPIVPKSAAAASPTGIRKRKNRKEKPRRWVWTIGQDNEEVEIEVPRGDAATPKVRTSGMEDMTPIGPPIPQIARREAPIPSIELPSDASNDNDVEMTDGSSVVSFDTESLHSVEQDMDFAMTPIAPRGQQKFLAQKKRDTPIPELATSRDEPVAV